MPKPTSTSKSVKRKTTSVKTTKNVKKKTNNGTSKINNNSAKVKKNIPEFAKKILDRKKLNKKEIFVMIVVIFLLGVLLIFSSYAWFSTSINVKIRNFNMVVTRNSGLTISFDAINYDSFVEISEQNLIDDLKKTYPNSVSQWAGVGLTPVSSNGVNDPNDYFFDIYTTSGVRYKNKKKENGFVTVAKTTESHSNSVNYYIAFDLFFKNVTGSPIADSLYLDEGTGITLEDAENASPEMQGLVNSMRIGFVKVGTLPLNTNPTTIQNMKCSNNCKSIIYEPNNNDHSDLSIERARKYGLELENGVSFPTYASIKAGGPLVVNENISGSPTLNTEYFALQETYSDISQPLFTIPDGVTKARVYLWIEGQDIDSLETNSEGAKVSININFIKDTRGYTSFN